jgi:hypothetical protein
VRGEYHSAGRSRGVEYGVEILHPRLQGGELAAMVGQTRATLVEKDQPETAGQ